MLTLLLDIKCYIATFDETVWYLMYCYDPEFTTYARNSAGITHFKKLFNTVCIESIGTQRWFLLGRVHREPINGVSQPAVITKHGYIAYYKNNKLHRENNLDEEYPAEIWNNGQNYYNIGLRHRDGDYPASIMKNGDLSYYKNGMLHRDNDTNGFTQPAQILLSSSRLDYYKNGVRCRDRDPDGVLRPAIIHIDGLCHFFENGKLIKSVSIYTEYSETMEKLKLNDTQT